MRESIKSYPKQFLWEPEIVNEDKLGNSSGYVVCGMGGSHLGADLIGVLDPKLKLYVHMNYGLPDVAETLHAESLYIASSSSGNTEEVLDFAEQALKAGKKSAVVTKGGKLLKFARENGIPYVLLPDTSIQPRQSVGYLLKALMTLMHLECPNIEIDPMADEEMGKGMASEINGKIPLIYSSDKNEAIAYNWKIKFNETAKTPAFYNTFPEMNHNELESFDTNEQTADLSASFHIIILHDETDHPRIKKRMDVFKSLMGERGLGVAEVRLMGSNSLERIMNSLILADWLTLYLAEKYDQPAKEVPLIEKFKKMV